MVSHKKFPNGFEYIEVENSSAKAKIALQGAHLFEYVKTDEESFLWLSEISDFEQGKSIRGGIPICWPWFGMNKDKNLPQHGFARTSMWEFVCCDEIDEKTSSVTLKLTCNDEMLKMFPYKFELELHVVISDELILELKTTNIDDKEFEITQALHTYFAVSHISHVRVKGLDEKPYLDALTWEKETQKGDITFSEEVDRVYQEVDDEVLLLDKNRTISIKNEGSTSVVVWNPWIDKCKRMSAMRDDAYKSFVCIESANAFDDARILQPKESHTLVATIFH